MRKRAASLLWGAFGALGLAALILRLRAPLHPALPWLGKALLLLLALRLVELGLAWRKGEVPATRLLLPGVVLAEGLGLLLSGQGAAAHAVKVATAGILELLVIGLALRALRRAHPLAGNHPEDRVAAALEAFVPPRAARLVALELVVLGSALAFLLGGWRRPAPAGFSQHRESSLRALLPALPLLIPGDLLLVHVLLGRAPAWARWALHGLDAYGLLWILGFYATLKARPHQLRDGVLHLSQGLLKSTQVPLAHIDSLAPLPDFQDDWARHAHLKGLTRMAAKGPAVLELGLREPVVVRGLLGDHATRRLSFSVDEPAALHAALGRA